MLGSRTTEHDTSILNDSIFCKGFYFSVVAMIAGQDKGTYRRWQVVRQPASFGLESKKS